MFAYVLEAPGGPFPLYIVAFGFIGFGLALQVCHRFASSPLATTNASLRVRMRWAMLTWVVLNLVKCGCLASSMARMVRTACPCPTSGSHLLTRRRRVYGSTGCNLLLAATALVVPLSHLCRVRLHQRCRPLCRLPFPSPRWCAS